MLELTIACILDILLGDPDWLPHPVVGIGKLITFGEEFIRPKIKKQRLAGIILVIAVISISLVLSIGVIKTGFAIHPYIGKIISILLIYFSLSLKSLEVAAKEVFSRLQKDDLMRARKAVSCLVSRNTEQMKREDVIRATIESVAENTVDGFVAPFFFACLGGAPLAIAYKAVNTLDSMIGYRNKKYIDFGWAAARLDDMANYIPARLCYILIPLASGLRNTAKVINVMGRDGRKHLSPNSGLPEAGFAAALGIQLGGNIYYEGILHSTPLLGDKTKNIEHQDIFRATNLLYRTAVVLFCLIAVLAYFV